MKGFKSKLKRVLRADVFIIAFALVGCHFAHYAIQWLYPVTGEPSYSWLYHTLFGLTRGSIILGYSYLVFRFIFPSMYWYFESKFTRDLQKQSSKFKICAVLLVYFGFLFFFLASGITK